MTFKPIPPNWLSPGFTQICEAEPELVSAYDLPDYPGRMTGEGDWADLYLDDAGEFPVGRLWVAPEIDSIGVEELPGSNTDHLTRIALQLRNFNRQGVPPLNAFAHIMGEYATANVGFGDLHLADELEPE